MSDGKIEKKYEEKNKEFKIKNDKKKYLLYFPYGDSKKYLPINAFTKTTFNTKTLVSSFSYNGATYTTKIGDTFISKKAGTKTTKIDFRTNKVFLIKNNGYLVILPVQFFTQELGLKYEVISGFDTFSTNNTSSNNNTEPVNIYNLTQSPQFLNMVKQNGEEYVPEKRLDAFGKPMGTIYSTGKFQITVNEEGDLGFFGYNSGGGGANGENADVVFFGFGELRVNYYDETVVKTILSIYGNDGQTIGNEVHQFCTSGKKLKPNTWFKLSKYSYMYQGNSLGGVTISIKQN